MVISPSLKCTMSYSSRSKRIALTDDYFVSVAAKQLDDLVYALASTFGLKKSEPNDRTIAYSLQQFLRLAPSLPHLGVSKPDTTLTCLFDLLVACSLSAFQPKLSLMAELIFSSRRFRSVLGVQVFVVFAGRFFSYWA